MRVRRAIVRSTNYWSIYGLSLEFPVKKTLLDWEKASSLLMGEVILLYKKGSAQFFPPALPSAAFFE
jgi:hypothetical protein